MNEVADRLHARPPAANGAEVRPGEIGKKVRLAISAGPKEGQRIVRQVRGPGPLRRRSESSFRPWVR